VEYPPDQRRNAIPANPEPDWKNYALTQVKGPDDDPLMMNFGLQEAARAKNG
jgi:hypothetical protein